VDNGAAPRAGKPREPRIFICKGASTPYVAHWLAVAATVPEASQSVFGVATAMLKSDPKRLAAEPSAMNEKRPAADVAAGRS